MSFSTPNYRNTLPSPFLAVVDLNLNAIILKQKDILTQQMQDRLKQILTTLLVKWECEPIELGGEGDHIHILFDAYPGLNLVNFIKNVKSVSSRHMRKEYKDYLEKYLWGGEFWNDGSTIISVGASASIDVLITYIKNQGRADKS